MATNSTIDTAPPPNGPQAGHLESTATNQGFEFALNHGISVDVIRDPATLRSVEVDASIILDSGVAPWSTSPAGAGSQPGLERGDRKTLESDQAAASRFDGRGELLVGDDLDPEG